MTANDVFRVSIPAALLHQLQAHREADVEAQAAPADAFLLFDGLGAPLYLRVDGAVIVGADGLFNDEARIATASEAWAAIVVGAKRTGIDALLELLPTCTTSTVCERCAGARWDPHLHHRVVCGACCGLGWVDVT